MLPTRTCRCCEIRACARCRVLALSQINRHEDQLAQKATEMSPGAVAYFIAAVRGVDVTLHCATARDSMLALGRAQRSPLPAPGTTLVRLRRGQWRTQMAKIVAAPDRAFSLPELQLLNLDVEPHVTPREASEQLDVLVENGWLARE